jgi:hypothetical protein
VKTCVTCLNLKPLSDFYKRKDSPDGYRNDCKDCRKARSLANFYNKHEEICAKNMETYWKRKAQNPNLWKEVYAKNKEKSLATSKEYYQANREERIRAAVNWAKNNKGKANANKKAYKASKQRACPQWVRDDADLMWMMEEAYSLAALRTKMFGFSWHVDHVVPLRNSAVSGLHVPWNLQVIPGRDNCSKSNKFCEV